MFPLTPHSALIHTMVLISAADQEMSDAELRTMTEIVGFLPVFRTYDASQLSEDVDSCIELMGKEDGLVEALEAISAALPLHLCETAYAVACDVAAADGVISQEVLRLLEMLRHELDVDRLTAAAIERGARARHQTL